MKCMLAFLASLAPCLRHYFIYFISLGSNYFEARNYCKLFSLVYILFSC